VSWILQLLLSVDTTISHIHHIVVRTEHLGHFSPAIDLARATAKNEDGFTDRILSDMMPDEWQWGQARVRVVPVFGHLHESKFSAVLIHAARLQDDGASLHPQEKASIRERGILRWKGSGQQEKQSRYPQRSSIRAV
jgi:hypothetical protein